MTDLRSVLRRKRDGGVLRPVDSSVFLAAVADGTATDAQVAAMAAAIFHRGMQPDELGAWTAGMVASGSTLELGTLDGPKVDKHSTGGVGDKVSLPLAPALAAAGCYVPMISGRGLGHTGGTLDKLEAIPGFRTELGLAEVRRVLAEVGAVMAAQTAELVPADRRLYALRDEAELVESIPLIASSIVSKKLAENLDALVLDVKFGGGAFLPDVDAGAELARAMVSIAEHAGVRAVVYQTCMSRPLGMAVGHSLEVRESLACLAGEGPPDLRELVTLLGGELLALSGVARSLAEGRATIEQQLDSGAARERFERLVAAQGGDPTALDGGLPEAPDVAELRADRAGHIAFVDCRAVGLAVHALGGGRDAATDPIDPAVGVDWCLGEGDAVRAGDALALVHHRRGHGLDEALVHLRSSFELRDTWQAPEPLVRSRIPPSPQ